MNDTQFTTTDSHDFDDLNALCDELLHRQSQRIIERNAQLRRLARRLRDVTNESTARVLRRKIRELTR